MITAIETHEWIGDYVLVVTKFAAPATQIFDNIRLPRYTYLTCRRIVRGAGTTWRIPA